MRATGLEGHHERLSRVCCTALASSNIRRVQPVPGSPGRRPFAASARVPPAGHPSSGGAQQASSSVTRGYATPRAKPYGDLSVRRPSLGAGRRDLERLVRAASRTPPCPRPRRSRHRPVGRATQEGGVVAAGRDAATASSSRWRCLSSRTSFTGWLPETRRSLTAMTLTDTLAQEVSHAYGPLRWAPLTTRTRLGRCSSPCSEGRVATASRGCSATTRSSSTPPRWSRCRRRSRPIRR